MLFSFGRDVNIKWKHGINALPDAQKDGKGRISIVLWGLASDTVEEEHSPPMVNNRLDRGGASGGHTFEVPPRNGHNSRRRSRSPSRDRPRGRGGRSRSRSRSRSEGRGHNHHDYEGNYEARGKGRDGYRDDRNRGIPRDARLEDRRDLPLDSRRGEGHRPPPPGSSGRGDRGGHARDYARDEGPRATCYEFSDKGSCRHGNTCRFVHSTATGR